MKVLDIRRSHGIECSEFSYEVVGDFSITDAWDIVKNILASNIVKSRSRPTIRFPASVETAKTIDEFKLKRTRLLFELDIKASKMKDFGKAEGLWNIIRDNRKLIETTAFTVVEREEGTEERETYVSPDSGFKRVKDQILSDYEQMMDYDVEEEDLDEAFTYKMRIFGEKEFLPTFCDIDFIGENKGISYARVSKKIGKALPSFKFDFKISFDVDWNIRYYNKYFSEYSKVYVNWCSLVVEKSRDTVSIYIEGNTDLSGQEREIAKAVTRVTGRKVV